MKRCSECEVVKNADAFHKRAKSPDGLQGSCKECRRAIDHARNATPEAREAHRVQARKWLDDGDNRTRVNASRRRPAVAKPVHPEGHKPCGSCGDVKPHADFHRRSALSDGRASRCKVCAQLNSRTWYEANRERAYAATRAWQARNPERAKANAYAGTAAYFARKRGAAGGTKVTADLIAQRWAMWGGRCYLCAAEATATDHVIPLKSGGLHVPANLRPICHACNSSKGARPWRQYVTAAA